MLKLLKLIDKHLHPANANLNISPSQSKETPGANFKDCKAENYGEIIVS
jgi:hypothetical protein